MGKFKIEICCGSADDVIQAKLAGADRVELNSCLFLGGLTPTVGELLVAKETGIEIITMVRPREGGFCYTEAEYKTILKDTQVLLEAGANGIAFGFLHEDGNIDEKRCHDMLKIVGSNVSVFHRAFDVVPDWKKAMDILCKLGVTRILTSGQAPSVLYGAPKIKEMREYANGRIEILPGAGINLNNVTAILEETGCDQIHLSMKKICYDHSTSHNQEIFFGSALYPPEDRFFMADSEKIKQMVGKVNC